MNRTAPANFFELIDSLPDLLRQEIGDACVEVMFLPLQIVYEQGSSADSVYIISEGSVEAITHSPDGKQSRLVAIMSRGDFFGDLAIFTGQPRLATVRAREATRTLCFKRDDFLRLLRQIPEFGLFFTFNLARRLHGTSTVAHHSIYAIDLTGNLQRFDLLTIVQAITSMGHTGELRLNNSANELLGSFVFRKGRVEHARFGHLFGLEAIWQGFVESATEGSFVFRSDTEVSAEDYPPGHKIDMDSTNLLLQGVGKRDTYQAMPSTLRSMRGRLTRQAESLTWKDPESEALARQIWERIGKEPLALQDLWLQLNCSAMSYLDVVMELGMSGQAELFVAPDEIEDPVDKSA